MTTTFAPWASAELNCCCCLTASPSALLYNGVQVLQSSFSFFSNPGGLCSSWGVAPWSGIRKAPFVDCDPPPPPLLPPLPLPHAAAVAATTATAAVTRALCAQFVVMVENSL